MHMLLLQSWNEELATIAQSHSDKCEYGLNDERNSQTDSYDTVGENIFVVNADEFNISSVIESWFEERLYFEFDENTCHSLCYCENYLQVRCIYAFHVCIVHRYTQMYTHTHTNVYTHTHTHTH